MVYNQIFGVNLEYGIHNTLKQVDVLPTDASRSSSSPENTKEIIGSKIVL